MRSSADLSVLHLEDSATDAELVELALRGEWPQCEIQRVGNRPDFEAALNRGGFNLILSDYTLPAFDGLSALNLARRQRPDTPFIFISGTIGEERAIEALKLGATDYLLKDRPRRLVPAIRQALVHAVEAEQRRVAELQISQQAALLDKARDAICVVDLEHRVTYWNASAAELFGLSASEVLGRELGQRLFPDDDAAYQAAARKLRAVGDWQGELRPRTKGGDPLVLESRWTLVTDASGAPQHILIISTDVTEKRRIETELLRTQRIESIGTLAGGIAHDLNNVLNPILGATDLLRDKPARAAEEQLLDAIEASAQHGSALIKQLLAFARGADGTHVEVRVPRLVADLRHLLRSVLPRDIELVTTCSDGVWSVRGDVTQLHQILINLSTNARDAMPAGGRLEIAAHNIELTPPLSRKLGEMPPGPCVRFTVTDTGTGIEPDALAKIFDPFFTTKAVGKGTGLGLSTVLGLVKGHGGSIEVESEIGRGTTFRLYLPALVEQPRPPAAPVRTGPRYAGEHVLVIDDDPAARTILRMILEHAGCHVFVAADGAEGLEIYQRERSRLSLIVTDMMMPRLGGRELIAAVRKIDRAMRIVAISALMDSRDFKIDGTEGPPIPRLAKPIMKEELFAAIDRVLARAG